MVVRSSLAQPKSVEARERTVFSLFLVVFVMLSVWCRNLVEGPKVSTSTLGVFCRGRG